MPRAIGLDMTKTKPSTFAIVATEFYKAFEPAKRDATGETFYRLKDGSPQWMTDAIHAAHDALAGGRMPDDWVYDACRGIASDLDDLEPADAQSALDEMHEIADSQVDVYTSALTKWLASHSDNIALCDEACEELGSDDTDTIKRISLGQYHAYELIGAALIGVFETESDERDSGALDEDVVDAGETEGE